MNIEVILNKLDALFEKQQIDAVEPYLTEELSKAYKEEDYSVCISIMNELIGFFRDTSQYDKSLHYAEEVLKLMKSLGMEDTLHYATTCLNVANALRAAGHHKESLTFYQSIFPVYEMHLDAKDERIAALYNNMSLLYQEMGDFDAAVDCLNHALSIVEGGEDEIKIAITHSNLGASLLQLGKMEDAMEHLYKAMAIFQKAEEKDFHYNAALAAMGQAYAAMGQAEEARECYLEALFEQMKHCGKSEAFYRILDNLNEIEKRLGVTPTPEPEKEKGVSTRNGSNPCISGLELSEAFYAYAVQKGLFEAVPPLTGRMAIGLVGEGSECFGFDDVFSADHDFGPGFCIWLSHEDYQIYGKQLKKFYDELPNSFMGYERTTVNGEGRVGVWDMDDFFRKYVGYRSISDVYEESNYLSQIPEDGMSVILNGRIFYDPSGAFTKRRNAFQNAFTDSFWQQRIALTLIELGKFGQYNYPRCMKRGDYVTAQMILYKYIESLLKLVHYVNHVFPPYYKWLKKSASKLDKLAVLADLTNALADFADGRSAWKEDATGASDKIVGTVEIIAGLIIAELRAEGILDELDIPAEELFLESYGRALSDKTYLENNSAPELVDYMVSLEWKAFDAVENEGGRADCQDDFNTFTIMRKSQYLAWPKELVISYIRDFEAANARGWNLITEKYGRMMCSTDPVGYEGIKDKFPILTETQEQIIEQIVRVQVAWMEEFAANYPHMAENSRSIHTSEDSLYNTSYETYLRGELSTYSHETLKAYGNFIVSLVKAGKNLAEIVMGNTAKLYGYASLEAAEEMLGGEY